MWLEDESVGEREADDGLEGGSLWYVTDGLRPPGGPGYAVHGCGAVSLSAAPPLENGKSQDYAALRLHRQRPVVLGWLGLDECTGADVPQSYFAKDAS